MMRNTKRGTVTTGSQGTPGVRTYRTRQPLYSAGGLNNAALPSELTLFGYKMGDNVPGGGNVAGVPANEWHTNMQVAGQLPRPEMFLIQGVRVVMPALAFTSASNTPSLSDPGFGSAAADADLWEDVLLFWHSCWLQLEVGNKLYVDHPLYLTPSNVGFSGPAAVSQDDGSAATTGTLDVALPHICGVGWDMWPFEGPDGVRGPVLIAEQQQFHSRIRCQWSTNPSMNDDRAVFVVLDGELTRASQ